MYHNIDKVLDFTLQKVMQDPVIAADGHSYESEPPSASLEIEGSEQRGRGKEWEEGELARARVRASEWGCKLRREPCGGRKAEAVGDNGLRNEEWEMGGGGGDRNREERERERLRKGKVRRVIRGRNRESELKVVQIQNVIHLNTPLNLLYTKECASTGYQCSVVR